MNQQSEGRTEWPSEKLFSFVDDPGEHDPCYVVMPDGAMLPLNHHATPGVDIARARFIVAACNAALESDESRYIPDIIKNAMLVAWNDFCSDTGNHPPDIEHGRGKYLTFIPNKWADAAAKIATAQILKLNIRAAASKTGAE